MVNVSDTIHGTNKPIDKLAMMANQIAQFFKAYPHEEAVAGISHHIEAFWTPKMRDTFRTGVGELKGVDPLILEAVRRDTEARNPISKVAAGPGKLGELGAVDAG